MTYRREDLNFLLTRGSGHRESEMDSFGIAAVEGSATDLAADTLVLARPEIAGHALEASNRFVIRTLPQGMDVESALLAPLLASALDTWHELHLELGEAALLTGDCELARLLALTALWHGACPVIGIGGFSSEIDGTQVFPIDSDEPESDMLSLSMRLSESPATKCIDLTGEAATIDILLEVLPQYFRMILGGNETELLTIDYYVNIHRKGGHVLARNFDPAATINATGKPGEVSALERAFRLLASDDLARSVGAACKGSKPAIES